MHFRCEVGTLWHRVLSTRDGDMRTRWTRLEQFETWQGSWGSLEMSWSRLSWVKASLGWYETYCDISEAIEMSWDMVEVSRDILWHLRYDWDKFQSIWEPFVTRWSRLRQVKACLKRYETCYDISYSIGISFMAFDWVWDDLRHFGLNLSRIERRWGEWVTIGWISKCDSSEMYDLLWVRHICCEFGTISGLAWRLVKSDGTSALNAMSEDERRAFWIANLRIWHKIMNWKQEKYI